VNSIREVEQGVEEIKGEIKSFKGTPARVIMAPTSHNSDPLILPQLSPPCFNHISTYDAAGDHARIPDNLRCYDAPSSPYGSRYAIPYQDAIPNQDETGEFDFDFDNSQAMDSVATYGH
jgi:hypothetical protein